MTSPAADSSPASTPAPDPASTPSSASSSTAAARPGKKKRRWRRILVITAVTVLVLGIALRVAFALAFPSVLRKVAAVYDLDASYSRMNFYALGGDVGLWGLKLTPKSGGEPLFDADYCRADISTLNLFKGKLVVHRVEADGVDMNVNREADGTIPVLQKLVAGRRERRTQPLHLSLDTPLQIDALRLSRIRANWTDKSVTPPVETNLDMTLRLSNFGSKTSPTRFLLDMTSPPLLDNLRVEGEGNAHGQTIDARMTVIARGIHPKPAAGYLVPLGIRPIGDDIALGCSMTVKGHPTGSAGASATTTQPADIGGEITIENVALRVDGREAAGVNKVLVKVDAANASMARLASVLVDGVRAAAERTPSGDLRVAGMEFVAAAAPTATTPVTQPAPTAAPAPAPATQPAGAPIRLALADLTVKNVRTSFTDASVTPAANLAFIVNTLNATDIVADPDRPDATVKVVGDFSAPGVARTIRLTGAAKPFAPVRTLSAKLTAEGVRPEAVRGYLEAAGVESMINDATATCDIDATLAQTPDGRLDASVVAQNIRLSDGVELFAFNGARVTGLSADPRDGRIRVDAIELSGPRLSVERHSDGSVQALGFRTRPPATQPSASGAAAVAVAAKTPPPSTMPAPAAGAGATATLPQVEIRRFTWKGVGIQLSDRAVTPPTTTKITDAGIELADVRIGMAPDNSAAPGRIRAWVVAPGMAREFLVSGTVVPTANGMTADLNIAGSGLNAQLLAPYLKAANVEPTLRDGSLSMRARAALSGTQGETIRASLALEKLRYADGKQELIGVEGLVVDGVELRDDGIAVASVQVDQPRARVERDADGALRLAGLRIPPPATQPTEAAVAEAVAANAAENASVPTTKAKPKVAAAGASQPATAGAAMVATLGKLRVKGGALTWVDRAVQPPVNAVGRADVELDNLIVGRPGDPASFKIAAKIDQTLESFVVAGTFAPDPEKPHLRVDLAASGMRGGVLAPYLPPGTNVSMADGRFVAKVDAEAAVHPEGGRSAKLLVSDVDYRDGAAPQSFFRFDGAKVIVSRADVPGGVVAIDEVSLSGLEAELQKDAEGATRLMGLTIAPPPRAEPQSSQPGQAVVASAAQPANGATSPSGKTSAKTPAKTTTSPTVAAAAAAAAAATTGPANENKLIARQLQKPPLVTLDKLDIHLKRIAYVDLSQSGAQPVALADVRLRNAKRIELLGEDATTRPPTELELVGRIDPLVKNFAIGIQSAPFATPVTLNLKIAADGIRGDGLTDFLPELREKLDGSALADGRFAANVEAQAKLERRGLADVDLSKPFEGSIAVRDVAFRAAPDTPVLAGVEEIRAEPVRVDPQTGSVSIRTLEITKPIGRAHRDQDGIHVLGLLIRAPATQPADAATTQPTPPPKPEAVMASESSTPPTPTMVKPSAEYRVDRLLVSGIDFQAEDRSVDPPFIAPINALEVEVRDLSNLALHEDRPIRFNLTAGAGKVALAGSEKAKTQDRASELFSEVATAGSLSLYPSLHGWARSSVSGFEMLALRSTAAQHKVNIEGGVFDSNVDVRIRKDGALDTKSRFAFTDLRVNEPSDGPVQRALKLPGSLDTTIIVLEDTSGAITVPLNVQVKEGEVGGGQIFGAAVGALGSILATAMASAPLKIAGGVTSLAGLDDAIPLLGDNKVKDRAPEEAGAVAFEPGVTEPADARDLQTVVRRMRKDKTLQVALKHEIGGADVQLAAARTSPPPEQCLAMAAELRRRKADLLAVRPAAAAQARATLMAHPQADDPLAGVRAIDRQLAATEDALDRLYELLRPGADRQADRRTRQACLQLAEERLATLNAMLTASGIPDAAKRVRVVRPTPSAAEGDAGGRITLVVSGKKKM